MSVQQLYLAIQQTLTLIRCDHTKANLPPAMKKERDTSQVYLPFRWTWIEQRGFVTVTDNVNKSEINASTNNSAKPKLSEFDEILAIDGTPIADLVAQVETYIPYDGFTTWTRNAGIADSLEFQGSAVDHFGALLWEIKPTVTLTIRRNGQQQTVALERINHKQWLALAKDEKNNFKDAVSYKTIDDNIAYLRVDTFVNYRQPVDPEDIYNPIFKAIKDQNRDTLIIDLRSNGGGSSDASSGLLANLISKKTPYKLDMFVNTLSFADIRPHLSTWDTRALDPYRFAFSKNDNGTYSLRSWFTDELDSIKPAKYAFNGKIILLTSNSNSSGSTNLLAVIQSIGRATLVGEKTGGSAEGVTAGLLFTVNLPESKITTRLPFFRFKNNVKTFEKGMGVMPDIVAPLTVQALIAKQDPAYEAALKLARQ
jgi:hypothetical protein